MIPLTIAVSIVTVPMLVACLGVRNVWQKLATTSFIAMATAVGLLYAMGIRLTDPAYSPLLVTALGYPLLLVACLMLVRNRGYRLVRIPARNRDRKLVGLVL